MRSPDRVASGGEQADNANSIIPAKADKDDFTSTAPKCGLASIAGGMLWRIFIHVS
jgi:hypothetical protein